MSSILLDVGRLAIDLHGVSAETAEEMGGSLERVLGERLRGRALEERHLAPASREALTLAPIRSPAGADAAALAGIVADRLIEWLERWAEVGGEAAP